ncbi:MAG TPA: phosphatidylserine decarboxylase [Thiotrichaceae bacterium]|nr:phosphatidylserine decarboxylase [Thiotrichaceae bacterium]
MTFAQKTMNYMVACFMLSSSYIAVAQDTPPVESLRSLYANDPVFQTTMDQALGNIQSPYNGAENPWLGKTFDDFCNFFNEWFILLPINAGESSTFPPGQSVDEFVYVTQFAGFYYNNEFGQQIVGQEPGLSWSKEFVTDRGVFMDSQASTATIPQWMADPTIHIEEYIVPPNEFQSFNEFFIRDLKPGTRQIASPTDDSVLVAPTDCVLNMVQALTPESKIPTKLNQKRNVSDLLNGSEYAQYFENGTAISCILLPNTYHHYHAVVSGTVVESKEDIAGAYWGIEDFEKFFNNGNIGYGYNYSVFEQFRRGYVVIETEEYGHVAMVAVGLDTIGSVVFEEGLKQVTSDNPVPIYKGNKVGHFAYGGSMVITLIEQGISSVTIPLGQQIGVFGSKKPKAVSAKRRKERGKK